MTFKILNKTTTDLTRMHILALTSLTISSCVESGTTPTTGNASPGIYEDFGHLLHYKVDDPSTSSGPYEEVNGQIFGHWAERFENHVDLKFEQPGWYAGSTTVINAAQYPELIVNYTGEIQFTNNFPEQSTEMALEFFCDTSSGINFIAQEQPLISSLTYIPSPIGLEVAMSTRTSANGARDEIFANIFTTNGEGSAVIRNGQDPSTIIGWRHYFVQVLAMGKTQKIELYIDGELSAASSEFPLGYLAKQGAVIGSFPVDDIFVYNRSFSSADVLEIYNSRLVTGGF